MPIQDLFTRVQWGKSYGKDKGVWYRVSFDVPFLEEPSVVIIGVVRHGALVTRLIEKVATKPVPPPEKIKAVTVPPPEKIEAEKVPTVEITRITIGTEESVASSFKDTFYDEVKKTLGDWGLFNWLRDWLCTIAGVLGWLTGVAFYKFWVNQVQAQIDEVRDSINFGLSAQTDRVNTALSKQVDAINVRLVGIVSNVNTALSTQVDRINASLKGLVDNVNSANSTQMDKVIERVNRVLLDLYESWGLPSGVIATPVHVRAVTKTGFEWQSFGNTTIYWIAVGRTRFKLIE